MKAVVFDVGETLVDETRGWERAADDARVPRFTLMGLVGGLAARGEAHTEAWRILGVDAPLSTAPGHSDLYADALPALAELRAAGYRVGAAGNMPASFEQLLSPHTDFVGSSERWGVSKPEAAFFAQVVAAAETAAEDVVYVGDRVDNDVLPALAAGMRAVHLRRGPWGHLHEAPDGVPSIDSLSQLAGVLGV